MIAMLENERKQEIYLCKTRNELSKKTPRLKKMT
jgi:hypothetical protein